MNNARTELIKGYIAKGRDKLSVARVLAVEEAERFCKAVEEYLQPFIV